MIYAQVSSMLEFVRKSPEVELDVGRVNAATTLTFYQTWC